MSYSDTNKNLIEIEESLKRRLGYEHATVECMRALLEPGNIDDILPRILGIVHKVVDNSRTYIFKNELDPELGLCMSQIYETVSDGIEPQIANPELKQLPYKEATPSLLPVLESRQHFAHLVEELNDPEKTILAEQGILSVLIIPIFAGKEFWGFIGFDDCLHKREWDNNDIKLLTVVADGIGEFISREKSEAELRESEERFRILHNATFGGILIHEKGIIFDCNQGLCDMSGYSKEELIGKDGFILVTEESKAIILEKLASNYEEPYEATGRRKDGTEYPIRVQAKNIPYKGRQARVTEIRDITEQKESENALRESEERFKALHNASFGGIFIHIDGIIIDCNQGLAEMTGYSLEELVGMDGLLLMTERYRDKVIQNMQVGAEEAYEGVALKKDGTEYPVLIQAKNIPYKGRSVRVVEFRDITEQKESERALKESEERFKALHKGSFGGIFINIDNIIVDCNQGLSEITGYSFEELIGKNGLTLIAESSQEVVKKVIATSHEEPYEAIGIRKDRTEYPLKIQAKTIPYKGKNVRIVEFRDITEQKKSENELRESEERFKALHNASFGGITIHDKGVILDCNLGLSEMTGYSVDELIGMNGLLLIAESSRELVMSNILAGYEKPYEAIGRRKDGTEYPVRLEARNIPYKGKMVRVVEFRDITERKESEKALRESEEKLIAMIENIADVIAIIDEDGITTYKSPNVEKWFGWKPEEVINNSVFDKIHPGDREKLHNIFSSLLNNKKANVTSTSRYLCKNGNYKWIEFTAINLLDEPSIKGILLNYRDITERKKAEDSLLESEAKQRAMLSNSTDVIAIIDKNGINKYKSPNVENLFGWKPEELVGKPMWENIHPDDWKNTKDLYPMFVNMPGAINTAETRYRCKDGNYKCIQFTINNLMHDPVIDGIMLNYHDITEHKMAENALKESEAKFRNYIENAPYGIFIIDDHGNYLEVNKTACILTGYDEKELVTMNVSDLISPESFIQAGKSLDDLKNTGFSSTELLIRHKDSHTSWIKRDGAKLSDNRHILFVSDITEMKRAENSLLEAKMLAEESNRIKSEFMANMSHELRTPLTAIIGFSDILESGIAGELNEKQLSYVGHVNNSGNHLLEIINGILDISKIESGNMELDREKFILSEVLNETMESMFSIARQKNIKMNFVNEINNKYVFADMVKFRQIMFNLLSNAVKFTPENGEVSVRMRNEDNEIQISVSDNGIGIPEDMQEEIFSPFTQVDASKKRRYGGTGLGLALVRKFVEMHGGRIWLESKEGKGSTFTFTIGKQD